MSKRIQLRGTAPAYNHAGPMLTEARHVYPVTTVEVGAYPVDELIERGIHPRGKAAMQVDGLVVYGDPHDLLDWASAILRAATAEVRRVQAEAQRSDR
jgi:hypothetical protein